MNVFILSTGRCGSHTFAAACAHITNFTAGHETRTKMVGETRLNYAENHIEADNHLSWLLGRLDEKYGDRAFYVHLSRDPEAVARTMARHWSWQGSMTMAYRNGILRMTEVPVLDCCRDQVATMNANIRSFLRDKTNQMDFRLETAAEDWSKFWQWIDAEGDYEASLAEWAVRRNASRGPMARRLKVTQHLAARIVRLYR